MNWLTENTMDWILLAELFLLMFVAFLIGYFFGKRKSKGRRDIPNNTISNQKADVNDIETIFSEIKPDIIKIIENHKKSTNPQPESPSLKKELNFDSFGYSDEMHKDDLTKIEGLSPFIEEKLNQIGINSFSQISRFKSDDIATLTHLIEYFPGRIERDNWVGQARSLKTNKATL
jgi:predicted flap endonuclease-1-like 5' DNA nuclease